MRKSGTIQILGATSYFIPDPLPPTNPSFQMSPEMVQLNDKTTSLLGELGSIGKSMPNPERFIKAYIIKEALLSSAIENIHTTMLDVFTQSLSETKASKQTQLVINYFHALQTALDLMQDKNLPLISKVFLAAHQTLMTAGDGDKANPGSYRKQSVCVGNFVPAPAYEIPRLMSDLEHFINDETLLEVPLLIKAGLAHVQFETIHPFLDGNGRIGRLLIILMLMQDKVLKTPILYPSYYLKRYQQEYYQKLDRVRLHGDFEGWILFYLKTMFYSAQDALTRAHDITRLHEILSKKIKVDPEFAKTKETALLALDHLFQFPVVNNSSLSKIIDRSFNTTQKIIHQLVNAKILEEMTAQKRNKLYKFLPYLEILEKEYPQ